MVELLVILRLDFVAGDQKTPLVVHYVILFFPGNSFSIGNVHILIALVPHRIHPLSQRFLFRTPLAGPARLRFVVEIESW